MFDDELISLHEFPREVAPFSHRFEALTARDGYSAARAPARAPPGCRMAPGRTQNRLHQSFDLIPMWGVRNNLGTVNDRTLIHARDADATVPLADSSTRVLSPKFAFT